MQWTDDFNPQVWCDYFLTNLQCMYMDMCFVCIAAVMKNHSGQIIASCKHKKLLCVMHEIPVFDRKVWFANCLYCIKSCSIGQYASGYMGYKFFPVLHILLFQCHHYQIHCSMSILHTYAVCYSYIIVGVGYLYTIYCKLFEVEKFCGFHRLIGKCETFTVKHFCFDNRV